MTRLITFLKKASCWLFLPGLALVTWGELRTLAPDPRQYFIFFGLIPEDKAQHFTAYFGLASMVAMIAGLRPRLAFAFAGLIAYGGMLEITQGYVGRDPEWSDFFANSIGASSGLIVAVLLLWQARGLVVPPPRH